MPHAFSPQLDRVLRRASAADGADQPAQAHPGAGAETWLKRNQSIPHEEVLAEFDLTIADWDSMGEEPLPEETPHRDG